MSKQDRHYGSFVGGKLKAASLAQAVKMFPEGTPLEFTVSKAVDRRTSPQNRYYWGVVVPCIKAGLKDGGMVLSTEQVHELLKFRFLKEDRAVGEDGEFVTVVPSTSELEVGEFVAYTDRCIQFAAEYLNVVIPEPGQQSEMELAA